MTKAEIVTGISQQTGIEKAECLVVVEAFMEAIKESIESNENVYLRGFGTFLVKRRADKVARNISKNTTIVVPAHNVPAFKPAKIFAAQVKVNTETE